MSLQAWLNEGRLVRHNATRAEISQYLAVIRRDLADAAIQALSDDRRFATAYNAALMSASAALAASGFRTSGEGHHYITIQSLAYTMQPGPKTIDKFNTFRRKRNISDYERVGAVSHQEVMEMIDLATTLKTTLETWLRREHPDLAQSE